MTLQEIQDQIVAVSANFAIWQNKFANPNSNSIEKAVAQQNIATFGNMLIQLKNQEQALLVSQASEQRSEDVDASQQSFLSKNKWWFIGGGILLVGGIATFLILRKKK